LQRQEDRLRGLRDRLRTPRELIAMAEYRLGQCGIALHRVGRERVRQADERLAGSARLLESLSYRRVLARGYAVVRAEDRTAVTDASATRPGQRLAIEFRDRETQVVVEGAKPAARPARRAPKKGQGELF
jgi:exodeoxyribonuclease VII large subunit